MTPNRVTVAMEKYGKYIPKEEHKLLVKYLTEAKNECMDEFMFLKMKGPVKIVLFSVLLGGISVDRFYLGDVKGGLGKLVLRIVARLLSFVPVLGIVLALTSTVWGIFDWFYTYKEAKRQNNMKLVDFLCKNRDKSVTK